MNMETMIKFYLLIKSARGSVFTTFDIALAKAVRVTYVFWMWSPTWLNMIANMENPAILPEAFTDFRLTLAEDIRGWFRNGGQNDVE